MEEKQDLRQKLEENSKKFSHLPVYDKDLETRKTEERRREMTAIFSSLDQQLGNVTDLTTSHMEKKGIKLKTSSSSSATPFDEEQQPQCRQPRHSADQSQGDSDQVKLKNPEPSPPSQQTKDQTETYESLGETFRQLTDKMETVTKDLKSDQIPYADDEDDYEDYLVTTEVSDGRNTYFWT